MWFDWGIWKMRILSGFAFTSFLLGYDFFWRFWTFVIGPLGGLTFTRLIQTKQDTIPAGKEEEAVALASINQVAWMQLYFPSLMLFMASFKATGPLHPQGTGWQQVCFISQRRREATELLSKKRQSRNTISKSRYAWMLACKWTGWLSVTSDLRRRKTSRRAVADSRDPSQRRRWRRGCPGSWRKGWRWRLLPLRCCTLEWRGEGGTSQWLQEWGAGGNWWCARTQAVGL